MAFCARLASCSVSRRVFCTKSSSSSHTAKSSMWMAAFSAPSSAALVFFVASSKITSHAELSFSSFKAIIASLSSFWRVLLTLANSKVSSSFLVWTPLPSCRSARIEAAAAATPQAAASAAIFKASAIIFSVMPRVSAKDVSSLSVSKKSPRPAPEASPPTPPSALAFARAVFARSSCSCAWVVRSLHFRSTSFALLSCFGVTLKPG
mmetsp:Transcript_18212/g.47390  ORF Transcript_18212/g.47390 Transcript_18212/m.47390 type:complete len:207 (+) Transcript_18212:2082-2702(+)